MLFSALLALMTGAAVLAVLWPLARARPMTVGRAGDVAVYRDQLGEIERDRARGLIAEPEAEAARIEVSRRLLGAVGEEREPMPVSGTSFRRRAVAVLAFAMPILALGFYLVLGSPELPGAPLAARIAKAPEQQDVAMLVQRIEAHLAANPDDGRGWELLAPIYLRMGRAEEALQARERALKLLGSTPAREADYGEALVAEARGLVTPAARTVFERVLVQDATLGKALFFLGLAAEQAGHRDEARALWSRLAENVADPWSVIAKRRLDQLGIKP